MNLVIVQARMTSTRLPDKVLMPIAGRPMLWHVLHHLEQCESADEVVVATTLDETDRVIVQFCVANRTPVFTGSKLNVLERYYQVALHYSSVDDIDSVVRITADCPLVDPEVVDYCIYWFKQHQYDCIGTGSDFEPSKRSFPDGFDVEIFSWKALQSTYESAVDMEDLEHVTRWMLHHLSCGTVPSMKYMLSREFAKGHYSVDTPEDFMFIRRIIEKLGNQFSIKDVEKYVSTEQADYITKNRRLI